MQQQQHFIPSPELIDDVTHYSGSQEASKQNVVKA